jgi:uncharacterized membrane protein
MNPAEINSNDGELKINQNVEAANAYFLFFISGLMILQLEKKNKFVRFHAYQSVFASLAFIVFVSMVNYVPMVGSILVQLFSTAFFLTWLYLIYSAYNHKEVRIPWIGDIAKERS